MKTRDFLITLLIGTALLKASLLSAQQNTSNIFFVVASAKLLGLASIGAPSVNNDGDIVVEVQDGNQYQVLAFFENDQITKSASGLGNIPNGQGNVPYALVRTSVGQLGTLPVISDGDSVLSYSFANGDQSIERYDLLPSGNSWTTTVIAAGNAAQTSPFAFLSPIAGLDNASPPNVYFYGERQPLIGPYNKRIYDSATMMQYPALADPIASCPDVFSSLGTYSPVSGI